MVSNWVWEKDLSFFEYHSLVQKNEWRVVMSCEYIDLDVISQLLCVWMVLLSADDPKYLLLPHLLGHISLLLFAVGVLTLVCGSCSSGLPQTIIQASSSEQISLVKNILVWEVYKLLNFEAPWETGRPQNISVLSVFDVYFTALFPYVWHQKPLGYWMCPQPFSGARSRKWGLMGWWLLLPGERI